MLGDALFAGFMCGHILALIFSPLAAIVLITLQPSMSRPEGNMPALFSGLSPLLLAVPLFVFAITLCSALGLLFGLLFVFLDQKGPGGLPGIPNPLYTTIVVLVIAQVGILTSAAIRRLHWAVVIMGVSAALLYGGLLPVLTLLSR